MEKGNKISEKTVFAELREQYNERNSKRITQKEIAEKLSVDRTSISRLENGQRQPTPEDIQVYCEIFDVTLESIMNTENTNQNKDRAILHSLGLTDASIDTIAILKEYSTGEENLISLLNAFIGNKEFTIVFLQQILCYLANTNGVQQYNDFRNSPAYDFFVKGFMEYINVTVRNQVQGSLKKLIKSNEISATDYES